jgi:hypothetical protein
MPRGRQGRRRTPRGEGEITPDKLPVPSNPAIEDYVRTA